MRTRVRRPTGPSRKITAGIGVAACLAVVVFFALSANGATSSGNAVSLQSVTGAQLGSAHLNLLQPTSSAAVTKSQAESVAQAAFPMAGGVRESVLAILDSPNYPVDTGKMYWVVSLDPAGVGRPSTGPFGAKPSAIDKPSWLLVFVDATNGQYVFATMG